MGACETWEHYDRLIESHNHLLDLRESGASGMAIGNENRTLESAFYALLNEDEVSRIVRKFGIDLFIAYLNCSAGTEFILPEGTNFGTHHENSEFGMDSSFNTKFIANCYCRSMDC